MQEKHAKAKKITEAVQEMMLGILHDTRNIRNNILDTVDVTKNHRTAVIEVKPLPKPTGPNLRKLRMGQEPGWEKSHGQLAYGVGTVDCIMGMGWWRS